MVHRNSKGKRRSQNRKPASVVLPSLSPRQFQVLKAYRELQLKHGYTPSYEEVGAHVGLSSVASVQEHLVALASKGVLTKQFNHGRSVVIQKSGLRLLDQVEKTA